MPQIVITVDDTGGASLQSPFNNDTTILMLQKLLFCLTRDAVSPPAQPARPRLVVPTPILGRLNGSGPG